MPEKIAFIGAGSMAEAIISGIREMNVYEKEQVWVTNKENKERLQYMKDRYGVRCTAEKAEALQDAAIVVLATKPYDLKDAVLDIVPLLQPEQLVISVVAGISTDYIGSLLQQNMAIVRVMPNTSASIGMSATAIAAGEFAATDDMKKAKALFETIGTVEIVDEEAMHTVTSISGSGPAYIYYLVEAMEKAAVNAGLQAEVAKQLIAQTVLGAGEMLKKSGENAAALRKKITSKKGTTEAGIQTLAAHQFQQAVIDCVDSARKRSIELGKQN